MKGNYEHREGPSSGYVRWHSSHYHYPFQLNFVSLFHSRNYMSYIQVVSRLDEIAGPYIGMVSITIPVTQAGGCNSTSQKYTLH